VMYMADNWEALFSTRALFRQLAMEVGEGWDCKSGTITEPYTILIYVYRPSRRKAAVPAGGRRRRQTACFAVLLFKSAKREGHKGT
jgi:hypothetical protein